MRGRKHPWRRQGRIYARGQATTPHLTLIDGGERPFTVAEISTAAADTALVEGLQHWLEASAIQIGSWEEQLADNGGALAESVGALYALVGDNLRWAVASASLVAHTAAVMRTFPTLAAVLLHIPADRRGHTLAGEMMLMELADDSGRGTRVLAPNIHTAHDEAALHSMYLDVTTALVSTYAHVFARAAALSVGDSPPEWLSGGDGV